MSSTGKQDEFFDIFTSVSRDVTRGAVGNCRFWLQLQAAWEATSIRVQCVLVFLVFTVSKFDLVILLSLSSTNLFQFRFLSV